jgi:hypothetical protein
MSDKGIEEIMQSWRADTSTSGVSFFTAFLKWSDRLARLDKDKQKEEIEKLSKEITGYEG